MLEQLAPLIVVAAFVFVKWLFENAGRSQDNDEADDAPPPQRPPQSRPESRSPRSLTGSRESDDEKMRRFMEALGLPPESVPPPPAKKKPEPQPQRPSRPVMQQRPATLQPVPPIVHPPRKSIARPIETVMPKMEPPKIAPISENAPAMEIDSIPQQISIQPEQLLDEEKRKPSRRTPEKPKSEQPGGAGVLREQMGDRAALRRAILLKEILGTPKGLQSMAGSTSFSPL